VHPVSRIIVVVLVSSLGGCTAVAFDPAPTRRQGLLGHCGADRVVGLIGAPVAALPAQPASRTVRTVRPGDPVTEDFSNARLNVILDSADRIIAVSCG